MNGGGEQEESRRGIGGVWVRKLVELSRGGVSVHASIRKIAIASVSLALSARATQYAPAGVPLTTSRSATTPMNASSPHAARRASADVVDFILCNTACHSSSYAGRSSGTARSDGTKTRSTRIPASIDTENAGMWRCVRANRAHQSHTEPIAAALVSTMIGKMKSVVWSVKNEKMMPTAIHNEHSTLCHRLPDRKRTAMPAMLVRSTRARYW